MANANATETRTQDHDHMTIAIALLSLLVVLLISLRKELSGASSLRDVVHLGFGVIVVCTFIALLAGYFTAGSTLQRPAAQLVRWGR
jgi:hypothetical protein